MIKAFEYCKFKESRQNTLPEIIDMLDNGGYIWYSIYYPDIKPIIVTAKKFESFNDIVNECISRLPKNLQPTNLDDSYKYSDVKSRF